MKIFIPSPGVAFLVPSDKGPHLHFILTFPLRKKQSEEVLVVGITSTKVDPDFMLNISDHPFITHESYINYPQAQIISVKTIKGNLATTNPEKIYAERVSRFFYRKIYMQWASRVSALSPHTQRLLRRIL